jgi:hypothetical protein
MCRLQFSSEPQSSPQGDQHDFQDEGYEENALEALLALAADNGMLEYPSEAVAPSSGCADLKAELKDGLHYDGRATGQTKDPSRYHCPFPGCKRSFQELWRLKVHYRFVPSLVGRMFQCARLVLILCSSVEPRSIEWAVCKIVKFCRLWRLCCALPMLVGEQGRVDEQRAWW